MEKPTDVIETAEIEVVAFAPEEIMVTDEAPMDLVIVEEPKAKEPGDYDKTQDLGDFVSWLTKKMNALPPHSGQTTAGCERVIAHLKMLDKEISRAIARDTECVLDDVAVEKFRKEIRKMVKKLEKRHKEINEAYDADDDKYAADTSGGITKEAAGDLTLPEPLGIQRSPHCQCENGGCEKLGTHKAGACKNPAGKAMAMYIGPLCNDCAELMPKEYLYPPHGTAKKESRADDKKWVCTKCDPAKDFKDEEHLTRHMAMEHGAANMADDKASAPDVAPKTACACEVKKTAAPENGICPSCKVKLWSTSEGVLECVACDAVYDGGLVKEANTPRIQLVMSAFERAITGMIVNAVVSQGKQVEDVYAELKKAYKFTERDELSIQQILLDMGYNTARNFMGMPHDKNIEFSTQYHA